MHHGDDRGRRVSGQEPLRVDRLAPWRVDTDDLGPVASRHLAHPLAEDAVDPDHDRIGGSHEIHERSLHACRPGPADGQRQGVRRAEDPTQAVVRVVEHAEELRIEVAEHRSGQRHGDLRVRVRRPGTHEQAVGYPHRRIVAGRRSPAPTRRFTRHRSGRLPAWNGSSSPRGRSRRSGPTWPKIRSRTTPGFARTSSTGTTWASSKRERLLHVVMVIDGPPPPETVESLQSLGVQTSSQWKLTVVLRRPWQPEVTSLLVVSGIRQHFDLEERDPASTFEDMLGAGLTACPRRRRLAHFPG